MNIRELVECCYCEDSTKHGLEECIERKLATARSLEFLAEIQAATRGLSHEGIVGTGLVADIVQRIRDFSPESR